MVVTNGEDSITICNEGAVWKVFRYFRMDNFHVVSIMLQHTALCVWSNCASDDNGEEYQKLVSCFMYLSNPILPDISFELQYFYSSHRNQKQPYGIGKTRVQHLKGTMTLGITYRKGSKKIIVYNESERAQDPLDCKFITCNVFLVPGYSMLEV